MKIMSRKLIIEGNAVYEVDEECMLRRRVDDSKETEDKLTGRQQNSTGEDRNTRVS